MKRLIVIIGVLVFSIVFAGVLYAETRSTTFHVTADVPLSCEVGVVSDIAFGSYYGAQKEGQTTVNLACANGTTGWAYVTGTRQMRLGGVISGAALPFELYYGTGKTGGVIPATKTGAAAELVTFTIYALIEAILDPEVGQYRTVDPLVVTIEF